MILFRSVSAFSNWRNRLPSEGSFVSFIPTMGALHEGHLSLVRRGKLKNHQVVVSIFVNPTQFNDPKDFQHYPITIAQDLTLLHGLADVVLLPSVEEMYPDGLPATDRYQLQGLEEVFEGAFRPGHFQGVCQVMNRLLNIVQPHRLIMGQKDFQQCMVVRALLEQRGDQNLVLEIAETIREESGLAMSSRNKRLSEEEKIAAATIWRTMVSMQKKITAFQIENPQATEGQQADQVKVWEGEAVDALKRAGFSSVDYFRPAEKKYLANWDMHQPSVVLCAATLGTVRLIDNLPLS